MSQESKGSSFGLVQCQIEIDCLIPSVGFAVDNFVLSNLEQIINYKYNKQMYIKRMVEVHTFSNCNNELRIC